MLGPRGDTPDVKTVATLVVPAGSTATADLQGLQGDPDLQNSFEVVSDQPPGEVVDNVASKSETGIPWVELPGKDLDNSHNAGNHPWTVADGTDSTMLLFNETAAAENFTVRVASGQTIWVKKYSLAALATKAIDIDELIEDHVKDDKGNVLPKSIQSGDANWFVTRQYGGTGRLLQSNPELFAAQSYSCGEHGVIIGADWYPNFSSEPVGETNGLGELDAQVGLTDGGGCYGDYVGDSNDYLYGWSSENSSIAAISGDSSGSNVNVQGVAAGTTTINGNAWDQYGCEASTDQQVTIGDDTPIISSISPSTWLAGGSPFTVTITGQHFGTNPSVQLSDNSIGFQLTPISDFEIQLNDVTIPANDSGTASISVTSTGYNGSGFLGAPGQSGATSGSQDAVIVPSSTCPSTVAVQSVAAMPLAPKVPTRG